MTDMLGLLNVHKPVGITSRAVVDQVQRLVKPLKVGHAGTLDPLASGVLVLGVGKATRLMKFVQRMPKLYRGTFVLGCESDTEDILGEVRQVSVEVIPSLEAVQAQLPQFMGQFQQRPAAYSAVKVKGQRAYARARKGEEVLLEPRPVQIYDIQIVDYHFPRLELTVSCGSGTYIRSLGRDLAQRLGTTAVMESLVRSSIGSFTLADAVTVDSWGRAEIQENLLPVSRAVEGLPSIVLDEQALEKVEKGQPIELPPSCRAEEVALCDGSGNLLAVLVDSGADLWRPSPNLIAR
ncbi:MAG: tRNA pseudouridine(55) synthase TruB [Pirellulaceae bacterium]